MTRRDQAERDDPRDAPRAGSLEVGVATPIGDRREYDAGSLERGELDGDPIAQLQRWLEDAGAAGVAEPTAVTLATVDAAGIPDARVVLLRKIDRRGVTWFTNRHSAKGEQLAASPFAAVVGHWQLLERQVRVRGPVELLPDAESDEYFSSRPREAQLGAWASRQSHPVPDRDSLDAQVAEVEERFSGRDVPRPDHWGGYLLRPDVVEFWQGRPARLHDRLRYVRDGARWRVERLQP